MYNTQAKTNKKSRNKNKMEAVCIFTIRYVVSCHKDKNIDWGENIHIYCMYEQEQTVHTHIPVGATPDLGPRSQVHEMKHTRDKKSKLESYHM